MTNLTDQLTILVGHFGKESVVAAAEQLLSASIKKLPAGYDSLAQPDKVAFTIQAVDAAISDVVKAGQEVDAAYGERGSLLKQKTQLETSVQLRESEAFMQIRGEARSQYVIIDGEKVALSNEETRKAYARTYSKEERLQLSQIESQLAELDVKIMQAKDKYQTAKEGADLVKAKAHVQGNLLNFLS
ncbi:hypothetical protein [Neobacillus sp. NPDC093127]|uniref:hypothetical protein n=1 Tax=Neobacillus sp. NPDC093127 TaxID=3364296 RepID=UPI003818A7BF